MARLEKLGKDEIKVKKTTIKNGTRKNGLIKKYETAWLVWKRYRR